MGAWISYEKHPITEDAQSIPLNHDGELDQPVEPTAPPLDAPLNMILMDDRGQPQLNKDGKPITES